MIKILHLHYIQRLRIIEVFTDQAKSEFNISFEITALQNFDYKL